MSKEVEMNRCKPKKNDILLRDISSELLRTFLYGKITVCPTSGHCQEIIKKHRLPEEFLKTLPKQVQLCPSSIPGESVGVFATTWIKEGTEMGPFVGRIRQKHEVDMSVDNRWMWEVFGQDGSVSHFVDASEDPFKCWIAYVQCARTEEEQNLDLMQIGEEIYYRTKKPIGPDQELLVWYSPAQCAYMGIPDDGNSSISQVVSQSPKTQNLEANSVPGGCTSGRLKCVVCKRGFNSRSNLRSHMRIHTMEKPFVCKFCQRCFSQSSTLRNHIRLHTGEKPYKCLVCHSAYSQLAGLRAHQKSARHRPAAQSTVSTSTTDILERPTSAPKECKDGAAPADDKNPPRSPTTAPPVRPLATFPRTALMLHALPKETQLMTIVQQGTVGLETLLSFQREPLPLVTTSR